METQARNSEPVQADRPAGVRLDGNKLLNDLMRFSVIVLSVTTAVIVTFVLVNRNNATKQAESAAQAAPTSVASVMPQGIAFKPIDPIGIDRSDCAPLPDIGTATCRAGEVGVRVGRVTEGKYRRVYCGGCQKFVYPQSARIDIRVTDAKGGAQ